MSHRIEMIPHITCFRKATLVDTRIKKNKIIKTVDFEVQVGIKAVEVIPEKQELTTKEACIWAEKEEVLVV